MHSGAFNPYTTPGSSILSPTTEGRGGVPRSRGERFLQATGAAVPPSAASSLSSSSTRPLGSDDEKNMAEASLPRRKYVDRGRAGECTRGKGRGLRQSLSAPCGVPISRGASHSTFVNEEKTARTDHPSTGKWKEPVISPCGSITVVKAVSPAHNTLRPPANLPVPPASDDITPESTYSPVSPLPYSDFFDDTSSLPLPLITRFDPTASQLPFLSVINDWNSTHPDSSHLTVQQQSILRHRVMQNDSEALSVLSSSSSFRSLELFVARTVQHEDECRLLQHAELDVLRAIFQSELHISPTLPITLRVIVRLDQVDCELELAFLLPSLYPLRDALVANFFIPPPFSDLFADDLSLYDELSGIAKHSIGEEGGAVYGVVETARQWMERRLDRLKRSMDKGAEERSEGESGYVRQLFSAVMDGANGSDEGRGHQVVRLFGRGRVEELMNQAILSTSREKGITRAQAKALLKEKGWSVAQAGSAITSPGDDDEHMEAVKNAFVDQLDSGSELMCLSCFDTFQWREGAMLRCHHFLCYPCYARYLVSHLNDGSAFIRDPGLKCAEFVSEELLFSLLSPIDYRRYRRFVQDNFITVKGWKWCPNPQCSFVASSSDSHGLVQCHCGTCYCVECGKAGHWPLPCGAAGAYFGSSVIVDLRRKYNQIVRLELEKEDEGILTISTKPCPKCKTQYERSEGCNHMKCPKCGAHYCFICLGDWANHGVEWFNCPFSEREVQFRKLTFHDGMAISDLDMDVVRSMVGNEVDHAIKVDTIRQLLSDEHAMSSIAAALPNTDVAFLAPLLSTLLQAHLILQHTYILLCVYKHQTAPHRVTPAIRQLFHALAQVEYFVDALDRSLVVETEEETRVVKLRQVRTAYQLEDTSRAVIKRMKELAHHIEYSLIDAEMVKMGEEKEEENLSGGVVVKGAAKKESKKGVGVLMNATAFFDSLDRKCGNIGER